MSQSTSPGGQEFEEQGGNGGGSGTERSSAAMGPYGARSQSAIPDLDASSPVLRESDVKRLNRKALVFLGGIVLLLVGAIFFVLTRGGEKSVEPAAQVEKPKIPDAPEVPRLPPQESTAAAAVPIQADSSTDFVPLLPPSAAPQPEREAAREAVPRGPSLMDRRMQDASGSQQGGEGGAGGSPLAGDPVVQSLLASAAAQNGQQPAQAKEDKPTSAQFLRNPDVLMVRGTYIRCVLETRIITDIPGFTSCIVTEPVYSINGRSLLLPRGSKVLGRYDYEPKGPRVAVVWDRITTPNGIDVSMESPGVDNLGGAGHEARYTAHWGSRIASALLISLISDAFKYAAAENGPKTSTVGAGGQVIQTPYESVTAQSIQRLANQALDNRRPATAIINQGTVVNVYVAKDVDFSGVVSKY